MTGVCQQLCGPDLPVSGTFPFHHGVGHPRALFMTGRQHLRGSRASSILLPAVLLANLWRCLHPSVLSCPTRAAAIAGMHGWDWDSSDRWRDGALGGDGVCVGDLWLLARMEIHLEGLW